MIKLFAGLGNPGPQYEASRHNVGFWWLDQLADCLHTSLQPKKAFHGLVAQIRVGGRAVWLLQPQTFMNHSGRSVAALANFYKIQPEEILVVHDELDLLPGSVRLKHGGGHGGHNGLRDIHAQLGNPNYWRLRLGIGHPGGQRDVVGWVLGRPTPEDQAGIERAMALGFSALDQMIAGDMDGATKAIHTQDRAKARKPDGAQAAEPTTHGADPG